MSDGKKKSLTGYVYEKWYKNFKWTWFDEGVKTKCLALTDHDGDILMVNKPYDVPNLRKKVRITIEEV